MGEHTVKCDRCGGMGDYDTTHPMFGSRSCPEPYVNVKCDACNGTGKAVLNISTDYWAKPGPDRRFDWQAIDDDTYDGAEDSFTRNQIGCGATEAEAIADLLQILEEAKDE